MGQVIRKLFVSEVDGYVVAAPFAELADAISCCESFGRHVKSSRVTCFWTGAVQWKFDRSTRAAQARAR